MINPRILEILSAFNIPEKDGVSYLLSIHYDCIPSYVPTTIVQKINVSQIIQLSNNQIVWKEPLFIKEEGINEKWEWVVQDYISLFGAINPKRKGPKSATIARMKSFFAQNPEVRKEDVLGATKMYIQNVNNPEYLISSHYFIFKDKGADKVSHLEEWLDKYNLFISTTPVVSEASNYEVNKMQ